jgi:hypothetical protein
MKGLLIADLQMTALQTTDLPTADLQMTVSGVRKRPKNGIFNIGTSIA